MRNERMRNEKGRNEKKVHEEPPHMRLPARFSVGNEAGERGCLDTRLQGHWDREFLLAEIVVNEVFFWVFGLRAYILQCFQIDESVSATENLADFFR